MEQTRNAVDHQISERPLYNSDKCEAVLQGVRWSKARPRSGSAFMRVWWSADGPGDQRGNSLFLKHTSGQWMAWTNAEWTVQASSPNSQVPCGQKIIHPVISSWMKINLYFNFKCIATIYVLSALLWYHILLVMKLQDVRLLVAQNHNLMLHNGPLSASQCCPTQITVIDGCDDWQASITSHFHLGLT